VKILPTRSWFPFQRLEDGIAEVKDDPVVCHFHETSAATKLFLKFLGKFSEFGEIFPINTQSLRFGSGLSSKVNPTTSEFTTPTPAF
jgi:hypothetical protein